MWFFYHFQYNTSISDIQLRVFFFRSFYVHSINIFYFPYRYHSFKFTEISNFVTFLIERLFMQFAKFFLCTQADIFPASLCSEYDHSLILANGLYDSFPVLYLLVSTFSFLLCGLSFFGFSSSLVCTLSLLHTIFTFLPSCSLSG